MLVHITVLNTIVSIYVEDYFSGSCPGLLHGPQRIMRHIPSRNPLSAPYFVTASAIYSEHVG